MGQECWSKNGKDDAELPKFNTFFSCLYYYFLSIEHNLTGNVSLHRVIVTKALEQSFSLVSTVKSSLLERSLYVSIMSSLPFLWRWETLTHYLTGHSFWFKEFYISFCLKIRLGVPPIWRLWNQGGQMWENSSDKLFTKQ